MRIAESSMTPVGGKSERRITTSKQDKSSLAQAQKYTKTRKKGLKWCGHVMRRGKHYIGRRVMAIEVQGRRKRRRPKRRWLDKVKDDIKEKGLSGEEMYDRATRRCISAYIDHT